MDGVGLAILHSRMQNIPRRMANTLLRTGRSGVLNTARDFSCCIITARGELLAAAESLPIHVLSGPDLMARSMVELHPRLARGDAFLHNSPYHGGSHPADHTLLVPVVDSAGVHRFTLAAKAHQADCGNSVPSTYHATARDVYEEGALLFPAVRVQRDYQTNHDILRMCLLRIRSPEQWHGDFLALLGAVRIGERALLEIGESIGWSTLDDFASSWLDYSERRMSQVIRSMPSGTAHATSVHDPIPGLPQGLKVQTTIHVQPEDARIVVDLRDNPDTLPCGLNLTEATARTAAMIGVFNSLPDCVPTNGGSFRRIDVWLRDGCIVGIPKHPTSCSVATTNLADRVANATQRAFAMLGDGIGMAECGAVIPAAAAVISGKQPLDQRPFVNQVFLGASGGAAAPFADAWIPIGHVGNGGLCFIDSVELDELRFPIRVWGREFIPDTEGAGRCKGAPSLRVEFEAVDVSLQVSYCSDGELNGPLGARGGLSGGRASHKLRRTDGAIESAPSVGTVVLAPGERIISTTCGGGGYGPPRDRAAAVVLMDIREKWISAQRAMEVYGLDCNAASAAAGGTVDMVAPKNRAS